MIFSFWGIMFRRVIGKFVLNLTNCYIGMLISTAEFASAHERKVIIQQLSV
jgi:hypothetical protein